MSLADLLSRHFAVDYEECGERERTATPIRAFVVRLHAAGLSLRETQAVLRLLGVERSFQAIHLNGEWSWLYAAIDLETKLLLHVALFNHHGTDPAAAFLHEVTKKHDWWFQTLKMRVNRFHNSWVSSRLSVRQWLAVFVHYYNVQRPHQALDGRTLAQEVN